eukprot:c29613_g1_i1 orf=116-340(-)
MECPCPRVMCVLCASSIELSDICLLHTRATLDNHPFTSMFGEVIVPACPCLRLDLFFIFSTSSTIQDLHLMFPV